MKIALITWHDAYAVDTWLTETELERELKDSPAGMPTTTLGFLFEDSTDRLVIIQSIQPATEETPETFSGILVIPRGMIKQVEILKDTESSVAKT